MKCDLASLKSIKEFTDKVNNGEFCFLTDNFCLKNIF